MNRLTSLAVTAAALLLIAACSNPSRTVSEHGEHSGSGSGHAAHTPAKPAVSEPATKALWKLAPDKPQPNATTMISIDVQDAGGKPVDTFELNHEKYMHLIVVSKDLSYFSHIHPEHRGGGRFEIGTALPAPGDYKLIADYVPAGGTNTTHSSWTRVEGAAPAPAAVVPDSSLTTTVDGNRITLTPGKLKAGAEARLTFHITDERTNKPVTDLQPYLGAVGHVVIMSADAEQYLHVHPEEERSTGPDAIFSTVFPKSGVYKIWGQFSRSGKLFTVAFVVQVPAS